MYVYKYYISIKIIIKSSFVCSCLIEEEALACRIPLYLKYNFI